MSSLNIQDMNATSMFILVLLIVKSLKLHYLNNKIKKGLLMFTPSGHKYK